MQCIVMYVSDMYLWVSEVISEIQIFSFGYLLSGHFVSTCARM